MAKSKPSKWATSPTFPPREKLSLSRDTEAAPPRPGSLDAFKLPSLIGGYRVWPDGRKEKLND